MPAELTATAASHLTPAERAHPLWRCLLHDLSCGTPSAAPPHAPPLSPNPRLGPAWSLLEHGQKALADPRAGTVHTPRDLAIATARAATRLGPTPTTAFDPCCGAGSLLLAVHTHAPDAQLYGVDHDPAAVALARVVLALAGYPARPLFEQVRLGDGLDDREERFELVIINPPYLRAARRDAAALRQRFHTARGAFDLYVPFLEHGLSLLAPTGSLAAITSNALLVADYARALRGLLARHTLRLLLDLSAAEPFDALIEPLITLVSPSGQASPCILASAIRPGPVTPLVDALLELEPGDERDDEEGLRAEVFPHVPRHLDTGPWSLRALGWRRRLLDKLTRHAPTLGERFDIRTGVVGFAYKAVLEALAEDPEAEQGPPVITCSLLRPGRTLWGEREVRLGGRRWRHPVLAGRPDVLSEATWTWFARPKVLIPGVARDLTAAPDVEGALAPLVAVHGIAAPPEQIPALVALIRSPPMRWIYHQRFAAARIPKGSRRIGVSMIKSLPIPEGWCVTLSQISEASRSDVAALWGLEPQEWQQIQEDLDILV